MKPLLAIGLNCLTLIAFPQTGYRMMLPIGHTDVVNTASFSPDGKYIVTASGDNTVRIWETDSGKELVILSADNVWFSAAKFSPDKKYVVASSHEETRIWEFANFKEPRILKGGIRAGRLTSFSPDSKYILTIANDSSANIWDLRTGKKIKSFIDKDNRLIDGSFSPDGKYILTFSSKHLRLWEVATGNMVTSIMYPNSGLHFACFSPEGDRILAITIYEICIWGGKNYKTLQKKVEIPTEMDQIESAAFSPDGSLFVTCPYGTDPIIWELSTGKISHELKAHSDLVKFAEFNNNGKYIVTGSNDSKAVIWDAATGKNIDSLEHNSTVNSVQFSPNGKLILTSSNDNAARIWELSTGRLLHTLIGRTKIIENSQFSPDGKFVASAFEDRSVSLWEVSTGTEYFRELIQTDWVESIKFCPDGKNFISLSNNMAIVWDMSLRGQQLSFNEHKKKINHVAISSDGKFAATSSDDETVRLWEVQTGKAIINPLYHPSWVQSAEFSPDNKYLATITLDDTVRIWEVASGILLQKLPGHEEAVESICFSKDGNFIITGDHSYIIRAWRVNTGEKVCELKSPYFHSHYNNYKEYYNKLDYAEASPDGKYMMIGFSDRTGDLLDLTTGERTDDAAEKSGKEKPGNNYLYKQYLLWLVNKKSVNSWEKATSKKMIKIPDIPIKENIRKFSSDERYSLTINENSAYIWETATGKQLHALNGHTNLIRSAEFSPDSKFVITTSSDLNNIMWDVETGRKIFIRIQLENENWLVKLPNSPYFMCTKEASKMIHYVTSNMEVISFEQLDPVYNRPDIVLDSIGQYLGSVDQERLAKLRLVWDKRLSRLNLNKELIGNGEIEVPKAGIKNADAISSESKLGEITITVMAYDPKHQLNRFNIYVNEVPLFSSSGFGLTHKKTNYWDSTLVLPLSIGLNKIQVSVMNDLGLENFKYPVYVNFSPTDAHINERTHFIGIAADRFEDSAQNLTYCVKDVNDLALFFQGRENRIRLIANTEVTRQNILALKNYLRDSTTVHDRVIISCSSHGVVDETNFYLSMFDMDFKNPANKGLAYEELESLLDGIPARKKLLMIDACYSGEIESLETPNKEQELSKSTVYTPQASNGRAKRAKISEKKQAVFREFGDLFINVRNKTGSVIICAAGAQQEALEGENVYVEGIPIKNGAFTFCVLEYLKNQFKENEKVSVNGLKKYVEKRVEKITEGLQKPMTRQETMDVDWNIN